MKNADILDRSLMKLEEQTGVKISETQPDISISLGKVSNSGIKETYIKIKHAIGESNFNVIVVPNASKAEILNRHESAQKDNIVFVSPYFSKNVTDFLIEKKINFIDTAGNTYLLTQRLFFLIKGNKKPADIEVSQPKRLFQETGLKVLFVLLNQPKLVNETYRSLAKTAKVSPSSVKYLFEELEESKFLIYSSNNKRQLLRLSRLLERWSIAYEENLKPKLHRGYFRFKKAIPKSQLKLLIEQDEESRWGGEFAAEMMTNYLDAQYFRLYSTARFSSLVSKLVIVPSEKGKSDLELLDIFWRKDLSNDFKMNERFVSPVLTYAELYNSLNERNLETAQKLLENELNYLL